MSIKQYIPIILVAAVSGGLAARFTPRPEAKMPDYTFAGPFRPKPPKPVPPEPEPKDDAEKKLFGRIREWVDQRAEARAEARVEQNFSEVMSSMDLVVSGQDPDKMQGTLGSIFVAKLISFVKWILDKVILGIVLSALGLLAWKFWPWIAGAGGVLVTVSGWFGYLGGKANTK